MLTITCTNKSGSISDETLRNLSLGGVICTRPLCEGLWAVKEGREGGERESEQYGGEAV